MENSENNSNFGYYPEDMEFDEKTQTLKKIENNKKIAENSQKNEKKEQNFAQNNFFNNFSNFFKGNQAVETLLKGGDLKNNFLMQALGNLNNKKPKEAEKKIIIDDCDSFQEL